MEALLSYSAAISGARPQSRLRHQPPPPKASFWGGPDAGGVRVPKAREASPPHRRPPPGSVPIRDLSSLRDPDASCVRATLLLTTALTASAQLRLGLRLGSDDLAGGQVDLGARIAQVALADPIVQVDDPVDSRVAL